MYKYVHVKRTVQGREDRHRFPCSSSFMTPTQVLMQDGPCPLDLPDIPTVAGLHSSSQTLGLKSDCRWRSPTWHHGFEPIRVGDRVTALWRDCRLRRSASGHQDCRRQTASAMEVDTFQGCQWGALRDLPLPVGASRITNGHYEKPQKAS